MSYNNTYPDTSSDIMIEATLSNKSNIYEIYNFPAISTVKDVTLIKNDDSTSQKLKNIDSDEYPKIEESPILKHAPKISFNDDVKEEMFQNISFRKFISEIEKGLFIFTEMHQISFDVKIYFQQDWEVKNLKNIILLIKFYDFPFKEELIIWENLSHFIRKELDMSKFYIQSKEIFKDYMNYNKLFYIKLDLN